MLCRHSFRSTVIALLIFMVSTLVLSAEEAVLEEGFLSAAIEARQAPNKMFNQPGNFTVGGFLGVGTQFPERSIHLQGRNAVFRMDRDINSSAFLLVRTAPNNFGAIWKTYSVGVTANTFSDGAFIINDLGAAVGGGGQRRLTIDNVGNFGFNTSSPVATLQVHGTGSPFLFALLSGSATRLLAHSSGLLEVGNDLYLTGDASSNIRIRVPGEDNGSLTSILQIRATSDAILYITDDNDNSPSGFLTHTWYDGGIASSDIQMGLAQGPNATLFVDGPVQQNSSFDLAESFWKGDAAIEPGHVVRVDPGSPNAVVLADREADPAVIGVVSTAPGFVLGGGAFSTEQLARVWGEKIATAFEAERDVLETEAFEKFAALQELERDLVSFESYASKHRGESLDAQSPAAVEKLRTEYEENLFQLSQKLERMELQLFFEKHFVRLALAGRVPVRVDASYGAVEIGDLLVASPTPGHVMRVADPEPGTIVGKALEPITAGTGQITMMVMLR